MNPMTKPVNAIARQIQIDMITDSPNGIVNHFNKIWENLSVVEMDVYHSKGGEFIYYTQGSTRKPKQWIFYLDDKNQILWCNYGWYWVDFEGKFNLTYDDIQALTQIMLENAILKSIPSPIRRIKITAIDNALTSIPVPNMAVDSNDAFLQDTINKNNLFQKMLHTLKNTFIRTPTTSQSDTLNFVLTNADIDENTNS